MLQPIQNSILNEKILKLATNVNEYIKVASSANKKTIWVLLCNFPTSREQPTNEKENNQSSALSKQQYFCTLHIDRVIIEYHEAIWIAIEI